MSGGDAPSYTLWTTELWELMNILSRQLLGDPPRLSHTAATEYY